MWKSFLFLYICHFGQYKWKSNTERKLVQGMSTEAHFCQEACLIPLSYWNQ